MLRRLSQVTRLLCYNTIRTNNQFSHLHSSQRNLKLQIDQSPHDSSLQTKQQLDSFFMSAATTDTPVTAQPDALSTTSPTQAPALAAVSTESNSSTAKTDEPKSAVPKSAISKSAAPSLADVKSPGADIANLASFGQSAICLSTEGVTDRRRSIRRSR